MKFMMNGALDGGHGADGATIEMAEEAGEENLFMFRPHRRKKSRIAAAGMTRTGTTNTSRRRGLLSTSSSRITSNRQRAGSIRLRFRGLRFLTNGDHYMHLADLTSYCQAQDRPGRSVRRSRRIGRRKAILNVASFGKILERSHHPRNYAAQILEG